MDKAVARFVFHLNFQGLYFHHFKSSSHRNLRTTRAFLVVFNTMIYWVNEQYIGVKNHPASSPSPFLLLKKKVGKPNELQLFNISDTFYLGIVIG